MTSRERVTKVLNYETPDRVPIDLCGMRSRGIHAYALKELKARLGMARESVKVYDCEHFLGWPDEAIRKRFHVDVVGLPPQSSLSLPSTTVSKARFAQCTVTSMELGHQNRRSAAVSERLTY